MIQKIGLKNFRVFKLFQEFELKPITILTGANNSGKSSVQKFLQLIQNSVKVTTDGKVLFNWLEFPEDINSQVGDFDNNISFNNEKKDLTFYFESVNSYLGKVSVELSYLKADNSFGAYLSTINFKSDVITNLNYGAVEPADDKYSSVEKRWGLASDQNIDRLTEEIHKLFLLFKEGLLIDSYLFPGEEDFKSPDILSLIDQLKTKGYKLNYYTYVEDQFDAIGVVWDPVNNEIVKYNKTPAWFHSAFLDQSKETVFSTLLSHLVLGSKDLLAQTTDDENLLRLKEVCAEQGILTKADFVKEYRKFELDLLKTHIELYCEPSSKKQNVFVDFFYARDKPKRKSDSSFYNLSSPIVDILSSREYKACFPNESKLIEPKTKATLLDRLEDLGAKTKTRRLKGIIPNTSYEESINLASDLNNSEALLKDLIVQFGKELASFKSNLALFSQQHKFTRYLLFNDLSVKGEPLYKYMELLQSKTNTREGTVEFINKWLSEFDLGEKLNVTPIKTDGVTIGFSFSILKNGLFMPLYANGLGGSKIIALILQIAVVDNKATILLEEPESNLHPAYQSKMAEMVAEASKEFGIRFIVETHSEYFIRKFQYLVASSAHKLKAKDISISYLYHPDKIPQGKKQVENLEIRPDGILKQDFGEGFFDENARLTMDLLKLQNQN